MIVTQQGALCPGFTLLLRGWLMWKKNSSSPKIDHILYKKITLFCPVSLADPFVLPVNWNDFTEAVPVTFAIILLLCNEMVLWKCATKCFLENSNRKLKVSWDCVITFFFIWFLLQVGNAKPEIQKVVDALNSIQTKVIYAVLDTTSHNCMILTIVWSRKWTSGSVYFFPVDQFTFSQSTAYMGVK